MKIAFSKYHGTGNDFIIVDNRNGAFNLTKEQINFICDRHLGIGADGLMLLGTSTSHDFEMKYYNADGGEGTMCGNGGRCITAFARQVGIKAKEVRFLAIDGEHKGQVLDHNNNDFVVKVSLRNIFIINKYPGYFVIDTGSPHYIEFHDDPDQIDIYNQGKKIRWDDRFQPEGLNVNFVRQERNKLLVRTFERGVEDITLSCGTGVTAAAVAADLRLDTQNSEYFIHTFGGDLKVSFKKNGEQYHNVWLEGPVKHVFDGNIEIS
ncbi:MAG: diaminopimelate epimerase [Bacteroidales bacterium]